MTKLMHDEHGLKNRKFDKCVFFISKLLLVLLNVDEFLVFEVPDDINLFFNHLSNRTIMTTNPIDGPGNFEV